MYNVSDAYLEAIKRPVIKYSITGTIGSNNFNAYTIKEGSFQITNQCTDTNELSLGSCAIGQLKATFCDVSIIRNEWLDKVITPSCSVEVSEGQYESVPLGVFTIKQAEQTAEGVQVTAYDNMFKFDKLFDATDKDFDKTGKPYYFLNKICQKCGVTLGMTQNEVNALPNGDNTMYICGVRNGTTDYANDIETYRDALFYLAQACACFATINRLGRLELRPFRQSVTDYISDTDRLAGAEFADYVTSFTGIYVDSLYDGRTTFYGYDLEKLQENLVEYTERKEEEEDVVDEDEADIDEIQEKYDQGQITEEEYAEQMAAATKKLKEDEAKLKATNKYLNWLNKAIAKAQANAQGTIMDLEGNPFLQHRDSSIRSIAKVTTATELRTTIMRRLSKMEYVPFSCSSVFGIHYDLGDRIMFTDGHADDDLGCITAFDWTYNGEYSMYGYGANPDESTVRPKIEKAMKQANENALNRPDLELVELEDSEGDPNPVALRKRKAFSEETATGDFWVSKTVYIWSYYKYSAGSVPQSGITKVKVSCTTNFALCAYDPGSDLYPGEQDNIVAGIKRHDLMITFVAIQIPTNELDSYELPKIKFECTRVYAPDPEHALDVTPQTFSVPEGQDTMEMTGYKTVQDPENPYQYWRLPVAAIQYGAVAHGIAEEFPQASLDFYFNSLNAWNAAGVIFLDTIPNIEPGDIVLPTASGQKQTAADVENIARKIAGAGSDPDEYVSPSYYDSVGVGGDVDVENQAMAEQIGQSLEKIFENLNECIRKIYKPTEEGGITVDYPEYYYHGGSANRLFNRVDYEGHDYATIGSDVPTLIADEYTRQELTALPGGTHLEDRYASGKTYIRVGDKSGMRLVGEAGQNKAHANEPFSYYLWDNHKTTRALESTGYRIDSYRVDGSSNAQYLAYRLTGIEGGKTYNISFDFGVLPTETPPGHSSDIYFSADDTKAFGMLLTTNPSFNDFGSLPVDSDIWHDDDPNNMYYAFAGSFTPITAASLPHYEFSFTAQEDKSYYIFFVTNRLSSEIQSGTYTYTMHMKLRNFISSEGLGLIDAEISFCNNPSVSSGEKWFKWNFTNGGGGGTSDLDAIEITYADYQLLTPEEKADPDKIYFITDYPSDSMALDDLSDVEITTPTEGQILTYDDTDDEWKNTDVDDIAPTVTEASARANLASGDSLKTIIGKIKKWFSDLKDLAFTAIDGAGSTKYLRGDGTWQAFPTIPTVGNGTITIQKNGTSVDSFTTNQSSNKSVNITMAKGDVGLGNVDNTSDLNKPISDATAAAIAGSKTATGSVVTVTDAADIYAEEVQAAVAAMQDLHGYPKPWAAGGGRNKLPLTASTIKATEGGAGTWTNNAKTIDGITYTIMTNSAGSVVGIKTNGTASAESRCRLASGLSVSNMILNGCPSGGSTSNGYCIALTDSGYTIYADTGSGVSIGSESRTFYCTIIITRGTTVNNKIFYPMLRLSSDSDTSFVPYENICPIQGYDIVSVDRCGKNLFDAQQTRGGTVTDGQIVIDDRVDGWISASDIVIPRNTTPLYVSIKDKGTYSGSFYPELFDENHVWIDNSLIPSITFSDITVPYNTTFTLPSNVKYIRLRGWNTNGGTAKIKTVEVCISTTNTSYEPYNGQTVSLQLGNKNLLPMTVESLKAGNTGGTWSGNVYTQNNASFTVNTDKNGLITSIKINTSSAVTTNVSFYIGTGLSYSAGNYILSTGDTLPSGLMFAIQTEGGNVTVSNANSANVTNKITNSLCWIYIPNSVSVSNYTIKPMLRSATVIDPTFSPYNPTLGGMVYGGQLTLNDDGSAVFVGTRYFEEFDGTEAWSSAGTGSSMYFRIARTDKIAINQTNIMCSHFEKSSSPPTTTNTVVGFNVGFINSNVDKAITIRPNNVATDFTSVTAFKTWLANQKTAGTPVQVCVWLQNYVILHLSAEQLKLLQGTNNVWSNAGDVTLKYQPDNVIAEPKADVQKLRDDVDDRLVGNACRNLVEDKIVGYNIDSIGRISLDATYDMQIAKIRQGETYTITTNDAYLVAGYFYAKPTTTSQSYDHIRVVDTQSKTFIAPIDGYIAFRTLTGYATPQCEIGSSPTAYEEYYPSNRELWEMIKALQNNG